MKILPVEHDLFMGVHFGWAAYWLTKPTPDQHGVVAQWWFFTLANPDPKQLSPVDPLTHLIIAEKNETADLMQLANIRGHALRSYQLCSEGAPPPPSTNHLGTRTMISFMKKPPDSYYPATLVGLALATHAHASNVLLFQIYQRPTTTSLPDSDITQFIFQLNEYPMPWSVTGFMHDMGKHFNVPRVIKSDRRDLWVLATFQEIKQIVKRHYFTYWK